MVKIIDWYGHEIEIDLAKFANEEERYDEIKKDYTFPIKNKELIHYLGYKKALDFFIEDDFKAIDKHYLYYRIYEEVCYYLDWRINNGYHLKTISIEDLYAALDHYSVYQEKCNISSQDCYIDQCVRLKYLIYDVDRTMTHLRFELPLKKLVLFTYAFAVKYQPPAVAMEASRSSDALSYLNKYGVEDKLWKKVMDERIVVEREKLHLDGENNG